MTNLTTYLNDHLAGSVAGIELAELLAENNPDGEMGAFLRQAAIEIREDQQVLHDVLARLGGTENPAKKAGAWLAERVGRLKTNRQSDSNPALARLLQLEGIVLGVHGKLCLWEALGRALAGDPRVEGLDFTCLAERARRQRNGYDTWRIAAAREAFAG